MSRGITFNRSIEELLQRIEEGMTTSQDAKWLRELLESVVIHALLPMKKKVEYLMDMVESIRE